MANDPMTYSSLIVGLWFYGVEDYRSPYVWSMCTRFVLCRNFKEGGSKIPCNGSSTQNDQSFIVVVFTPNHHPQFLKMKVSQEGN